MSRFATMSRRNLIMPWKMLALAVLLLGFGNHALAGVIWNLNATFTDGMTASGVFVTDDSMDFTSWDVFFAGGTLAHDFESSSATLPPGAIGVEIPGFRPVRGLLSGLLTDGCGRWNPPRRRIQLRWHVLRTQFERFQYVGWNCGARTVHHRSDGSHPRSSIRRPPPQADSRQVRCAGACGAGVARQSRTGHEACPTGSATSASPA